jgi:hypothetical protein
MKLGQEVLVLESSEDGQALVATDHGEKIFCELRTLCCISSYPKGTSVTGLRTEDLQENPILSKLVRGLAAGFLLFATPVILTMLGKRGLEWFDEEPLDLFGSMLVHMWALYLYLLAGPKPGGRTTLTRTRNGTDNVQRGPRTRTQ